MHPKTHSLPFPARETSNDEKRGMEVLFSLEKESNHRIVWIYVLEDAKDSQQHDFLKKVILIWEKRKHNEVCFRTDKKFSQKKIQKNKQTVFVWTHFFFDNDLNNLYSDLLFSFNNTINSTNWFIQNNYFLFCHVSSN